MSDEGRPEQVTKTEAEADTAKRKPRRWRRRLLLAAGTLVVLLLLLVALAPMLLSTGPGRSLVFGIAAGQLGGQINADSMRLKWLGGQSLEGLNVDVEIGGMHIVAKDVDLHAPDLSLLSLVRGSRALGDVQLAVADRLTITQLADGDAPAKDKDASGGDRGSGGASSDKAEAELPSGRIKLTAKQITYEMPGQEPVQLQDVDGVVDLTQDDVVKTKLSTTVQRGSDAGEVAIDATVLNVAAAMADWQQAEVDADVRLERLPTPAIDRVAGLDDLLAASLGEWVTAVVRAKGTVAKLDGSVDVLSQRLQTSASLSASGDAVVARFARPLNWQVTPEAWDKLLGGTGAAELLDPVDLKLNLEQLHLPLEGQRANWQAGRVKLTGNVPAMRLSVPGQGSGAMTDVQLDIESAEIGQLITGDLTGKLAVDGGDGPQPMTIHFRGENAADPSKVAASLTATQLPLVLIDTVARQEGRIYGTVGHVRSLNASARRTGPTTWAGRLAIDAAKIQGAFAFDYAATGGGQVALATPDGPLRATIEPATIKAWMKAFDVPEASVRLLPVSTAELRVELADVLVALRDAAGESAEGALPILPDATRLHAAIAIPKLRLHDQLSGETMSLTETAARLDSDSLRKGLSLSLQADVADAKVAQATLAEPAALAGGVAALHAEDPTAASQLSGPGKLRLEAKATNLFDANDVLQPRLAHIEAKAHLQAFPTGLADALAQQKGVLAAVLGDRAAGEVDAHYVPGEPSNVQAQFVSTNTRGKLVGAISPDGLVTFNEPPSVQLAVTESTAAALLGNLHPVLGDAIASESPIKLSIDSKSLHLPLNAKGIKQIKLSGTLDLGQLRMSRRGWLAQGLSGTLQQIARGKNWNDLFGKGGTYMASFTPMDFKLEDGKLTTSEMWLTSRDMGLGFQGGVDFNTRKIDMRLGLLGATLITAMPFAEGALKPGHVVEVPLGGTLDEPKLDTGKLISSSLKLFADPYLDDAIGELPDELQGIVGGLVRKSIEEDALGVKPRYAWHLPGGAQSLVASFEAEDADGGEAETPADVNLDEEPKLERRPGETKEEAERRWKKERKAWRQAVRAAREREAGDASGEEAKPPADQPKGDKTPDAAGEQDATNEPEAELSDEEQIIKGVLGIFGELQRQQQEKKQAEEAKKAEKKGQ